MTFAHSNLHRPVIRLSASLTITGDGPSRMVKRPTGSDGEPSSPNCGASAGVKVRHLTLKSLCWKCFPDTSTPETAFAASGRSALDTALFNQREDQTTTLTNSCKPRPVDVLGTCLHLTILYQEFTDNPALLCREQSRDKKEKPF